ncbi:Putative alpha-1,2-mannosidase [Capnocytophaga canimorsus]|nr:GH92 family glycosyl hydrolase [Capnocytophaga canimorsus]ATA77410.1 alpha-mannosidase [Capnocytophaga canimorsus]PJI83416.1 putative alpha-1,2-mannosidase [Capnocytophaga canimorsus]STA72661.1 Putative alpha-1,2-mannosidase [Capnocytophaga canimorsus]
MIRKYISSLALLGLMVTSCQEVKHPITEQETQQKPLTTYVDSFIGTGGHGHTYPGATVPFGMLQVSPVNGISGWDWCSGYHHSDTLLIGFGHLSLSGTGIGDLNDILLMPVNKEYDLSQLSTGKKDQYPKAALDFRNQVSYKSRYSHQNEKAEPGYYQVFLEDPKVNAELTADQYVAYHKYTYQKGDTQSVILNLGFAINWDSPTEMFIQQSNRKLDGQNDGNIITGHRFSTGWAKNQKVFFAIAFSKPIKDLQLQNSGKQISSGQFFFDNSTGEELVVRVAVSSVSEENALANLDLYNKRTFAEVRQKAHDTWEKHLSSIEIETPVDSLKTIFYTALYHTQVAPVTFSDKNGQFRQQNDEIYSTKDFTAYSTLSLWDTFRAENPLITLLQPKKSSDIISSMLAYSDVINKLPVWTLYGNETDCMTGYHSIPVIVEAYLKGVRSFDAEKAFEMMKKTMMGDERGLKFYKQYGYIPYDKWDESVTITLEYAYDDWCVAQMAKALGKTDDYEFFMKRSEAYKHLFDPTTGFMRGKSASGKWREPFDPKHSNHREATDYTEGNAWQHSWFVPQNPQGLIEAFGGKEKFTTHLEKLFTESSEITGDNVSADITGLIGQYAHGNEPSHHIAYLFNKAGEPHRTQYWVNEILKTQYNTTPNGYSGNEDCGQMSAWYVWSSIGLYPMNPVSGEYEIGRPLFPKAKINLPNGETFTIIAENVSAENMYIQSATLNGKPLDRTFITDEELKNGGELKFIMGSVAPTNN